MKRWAGPGILLLTTAAGLWLRGPDLAVRPLHNDEAVNAFKLDDLWLHHRYRYDPEEFHGPALYYLALPVLGLASIAGGEQPTIVSMRAVTVLFGIGCLLLLGLAADGLGWPVVIAAAILTAVSPAMVFYSRYFIHEIPLIFFTGLALVSAWRYTRRPCAAWAAGVGLSLGLMYATKETFVFAVLAAAIAWVASGTWEPAQGAGSPEDGTAATSSPTPGNRLSSRWRSIAPIPRPFVRHVLIGAASAALVATLLYTSLFTHLRGPWDAIRTYAIWLTRARGDSPHVHPWYFYWNRLGWFQARGGPIWTEAAVLLLAAIGAIGVWRPRRATPSQRRLGRFVLLYSVLLAAIYCMLPYKTPWCLLGFYQGFLVLAGIGARSLLNASRRMLCRGLAAAVLLGAIGHLAWEARRASFEFAADFRNPYVYGQTSADVENLLDRVSALARVHPAGHGMPMQVIAPDNGYWPLPWYWRDFTKVGWWDHVPENPFAPVIVVANKLGAALDERSHEAWQMVGMFELRPRFFLELYVEKGLWKRFLAAQSAARSGENATSSDSPAAP